MFGVFINLYIGDIKMARLPDHLVHDITLDQAQRVLMNKIYEASALMEQLELAGRINGNRHHMKQKLSQVAEKMLADRWIK